MRISYLRKLLELVNETSSLSDKFHLSTNSSKIDKFKQGNAVSLVHSFSDPFLQPLGKKNLQRKSQLDGDHSLPDRRCGWDDFFVLRFLRSCS